MTTIVKALAILIFLSGCGNVKGGNKVSSLEPALYPPQNPASLHGQIFIVASSKYEATYFGVSYINSTIQSDSYEIDGTGSALPFQARISIRKPIPQKRFVVRNGAVLAAKPTFKKPKFDVRRTHRVNGLEKWAAAVDAENFETTQSIPTIMTLAIAVAEQTICKGGKTLLDTSRTMVDPRDVGAVVEALGAKDNPDKLLGSKTPSWARRVSVPAIYYDDTFQRWVVSLTCSLWQRQS